MDNVTEITDFVNKQAEFHERKDASFRSRAENSQSNAARSQLRSRAKSHAILASQFRRIATMMKDALIVQSIAPSNRNLGLTPHDIDGLPDELIQELSISDADIADFGILSVVDEAGGILSLDKILIGLYKRSGEIHKRTAINSRIYRMIQKGLMFPVPSRKGVYSTREITEEEAENIS